MRMKGRGREDFGERKREKGQKRDKVSEKER